MKRTIAVALPIVAFLVLFERAPLHVTLIASVLVAASSFIWRPWREALVGLSLVVVCAGAMLITGEARGFFLVPVLLPFVITIVCLGSVLAGQPLAGVLLNRVAKGPADWRGRPPIRAIYGRSTLIFGGVDLAIGALQLACYARNYTTALAVSHIASGPIFASIVAATVVLVRRKS